MKNLFLIFSIFLAIGCQSTNNKVKRTTSLKVNEPYLTVARTACLAKHGAENSEFCDCYANIQSDIVPEKLKKRVLQGDSSATLDLVSVMVDNNQKLKSCEPKFAKPKLIKVDINIPPFDVPPLAKKVLNDNAGFILTPENRMSITPFLPIGYEFYLKLVGGEPAPHEIMRLTAINNNAYFFTKINSATVRQNTKKYEYGQEYYLALNEPPNTYKTSSDDRSCIFVINEVCEYHSYDKKKTFQMYTIFKNGMWISVQPSHFRNGTILNIRIFGIDGLPLYKLIKVLQNGNQAEFLREEPVDSWLKYIN